MTPATTGVVGSDAPTGHRLSIRGRRGSAVGRCSCGAVLQPTVRALAHRQIRRAHATHIDAVTDYATDLHVACTLCEVDPGVGCRGLPPGVVHGTRRIRRLLFGLPLAKQQRAKPSV